MLARRGGATTGYAVLRREQKWEDGRALAAAGRRDGAATCERTEDAADLALPVRALGTAYLGGPSLASVAAHLPVEERTPGALRALSRAMRADTEPAAAIGF